MSLSKDEEVILYRDKRKIVKHGSSYHVSQEKGLMKKLLRKLGEPVLEVTWKRVGTDIVIEMRAPRKDGL